MASSAYGRQLNPFRRLKTPLGVKGRRQSVTITHNPTTIDQKQKVVLRFQDLAKEDVIVPGTVRLAFTISLRSTDANRTLVQNLGRAIVNKIVIKISGNDVMSIDNSDMYHCYMDLWKTAQERKNAQYQGIDTSANRNVTKLRIGSADGNAEVAEDSAIAGAFGNRYYIPLDFELLESHMPFYQAALGGSLEYILTFNDYNRVIRATGDDKANYTIENISLEFDKVNQSELARLISNQHAKHLAILFDRIHLRDMRKYDKSDSLWNFDYNDEGIRSMKGILMLFEDDAAQQDFQRESETFYNPKITKVKVSIDGVNNQLYDSGLHAYQQWDEARRLFAASPGSKRHPEVAEVAKDLALADVSLGEFLTTKYALWLDLRTTGDEQLHGNGRRIGNGISINIKKEVEAPGALNIYVYFIMDAQLNLEDGKFKEVLY